MKTIPHPSGFINKADVTIIRQTAAEAEAMGMLHPDQLKIIYQQNWFKLLVPRTYGGLETALPNLVRLQEAISWADGSTGWVLTLCSGAGWFGGFIDPTVAKQVFNTPDVCLAGSGAVTGEAEIIPEGYRINGTWNYASGAHHATHFTANCLIKKNGEPVSDDDNNPLVLPFIIDKKAVTLLPTWKYIGMVATGSHSFKIDNLALSPDRSFHIDAAYARIDSLLYQYPFLQLAEATLAVNLSGMAIHFTDLCRDIFAEKIKQPKITTDQQTQLTQLLAGWVDKLNVIRHDFFNAVDNSWANAIPDTLKQVSAASRDLARTARECVDQLYPYCGLMAASPDAEINRVWRDLHTASQHSLLTFGG